MENPLATVGPQGPQPQGRYRPLGKGSLQLAGVASSGTPEESVLGVPGSIRRSPPVEVGRKAKVATDEGGVYSGIFPEQTAGDKIPAPPARWRKLGRQTQHRSPPGWTQGAPLCYRGARLLLPPVPPANLSQKGPGASGMKSHTRGKRAREVGKIHQAVHSMAHTDHTMEEAHMGVLSPYNPRSTLHTVEGEGDGGMLAGLRNTVSEEGREHTDHPQVPVLEGVRARRSSVPAGLRPCPLGHEAETSWQSS